VYVWETPTRYINRPATQMPTPTTTPNPIPHSTHSLSLLTAEDSLSLSLTHVSIDARAFHPPRRWRGYKGQSPVLLSLPSFHYAIIFPSLFILLVVLLNLWILVGVLDLTEEGDKVHKWCVTALIDFLPSFSPLLPLLLVRWDLLLIPLCALQS
jgi:hypothetical protein